MEYTLHFWYRNAEDVRVEGILDHVTEEELAVFVSNDEIEWL